MKVMVLNERSELVKNPALVELKTERIRVAKVLKID